MQEAHEQEAQIFGPVAGRKSLNEVVAFMRDLPVQDAFARRAAAAYAMVLVARAHIRPGSDFYEGKEAVNDLSRAKCELDIAIGHEPSIAELTSDILLDAQRAFDEAIIPCTEWATTEEIHGVVVAAAKRALEPNPSYCSRPAAQSAEFLQGLPHSSNKS